jgi:hypothetical protein
MEQLTRHARSIAALVIAGAAVATPAVAAGKASHAKLWQNASGSVGCGIKAPLPQHHATELLCSAHGIPRPPGSSKSVGDPYVQLASSGKPHLVLISQFSYETMHSTQLANGSTWSSLGVTCTVGKTVKCTNGTGHGFKIGNGKYKSF